MEEFRAYWMIIWVNTQGFTQVQPPCVRDNTLLLLLGFLLVNEYTKVVNFRPGALAMPYIGPAWLEATTAGRINATSNGSLNANYFYYYLLHVVMPGLMSSGACSNACLHGSPLDNLGDPTDHLRHRLGLVSWRCWIKFPCLGPGLYWILLDRFHTIGLPDGDYLISSPRVCQGLIAKTACVLHGNDFD